MPFRQTLNKANRVYAYFSCANGAAITIKLTKKQVLDIAYPSRLRDVYSPQPNPPEWDGDDDPTCTYSIDEDGNLHLHFAT